MFMYKVFMHLETLLADKSSDAERSVKSHIAVNDNRRIDLRTNPSIF